MNAYHSATEVLKPAAATLVYLRAEHPAAGRASELLGHFALTLPVTFGPVPTLVAEIECPNRGVALQSAQPGVR